MKKLILTLLILLFAYPVCAYEFGEHWTKKDTLYQATFVTLTIIDWGQTRWMAERNYHWDGGYYKDINPLLGSHPSMEKVDTIIPLSILAHTLISLALPDKAKIFGYEINPRRIWQGTFIVVESGAVLNNAIGGVRIEF